MRRHILLLALLLFATTVFAQTIRTESGITGLGQFRFGMTPLEMKEPILDCMTEDTDFYDGKDGSIMATNLRLGDHVFKTCLFKLNEHGLYDIVFEQDFDKGDDSIVEIFADIKNMFEIDYGKQTTDYNFDPETHSLRFSWIDQNRYVLMLSMMLGNIGEQNQIMIVATQELE